MRRCSTCARRKVRRKDGRAYDYCPALTAMIGKTRDCFAWTDDLLWERKYRKAKRAYAER